MGYTTDLTMLKSSYGWDDNIRVGCPALWFMNYYDSGDPVEALVMGTLNPKSTTLSGYAFDGLCMRGNAFTRGLMWPKVGTAGGYPAVGHSQPKSFNGFNDNIDATFQKECVFNTASVKNSNLVEFYVQKVSDTQYTLVVRIDLPMASHAWTYWSGLSSAATLLELLIKLPKSIHPTYDDGSAQIPYTFSKSNCTFTTIDSTMGTVVLSRTLYSSPAPRIVTLYNELSSCANQGLPVGVRLGCYYGSAPAK